MVISVLTAGFGSLFLLEFGKLGLEVVSYDAFLGYKAIYKGMGRYIESGSVGWGTFRCYTIGADMG